MTAEAPPKPRCHFCGGPTRPHCTSPNANCTWVICHPFKTSPCGYGVPGGRWALYP